MHLHVNRPAVWHWNK